jgi:glycosyltransferase involved in cell wall biosynthesis
LPYSTFTFNIYESKVITMKILMLGWEYPPNITGGLATACHGLVQELLIGGEAIYFVIPKADAPVRTERFELISASSVALPDVPETATREFLNHYLPAIGLQDFQKNETYTFSGAYGPNLLEEVYWYAVVVSKMAATLTFDVIHAHDWLTYLAGLLVKKLSGKPLVVHVHATEFDRSPRTNALVYEIERLGMQGADKVITVSNLSRNTIINKYYIQPQKVITAYNGVLQNETTSVYPKKISDRLVTFLGRITYQKGPEYFLEAAEKVLARVQNVRFVMAGSGDLMEKMIRLTASKRMSHHFHFTGYLKSGEVERMLSLTDIFVMPSVSEPFGIVALEAIRAGVPIIISKQSGAAEVLPHALTFDYWDTDCLADQIYGLLNHSSLVKTAKLRNQKSLKKLTWERAAARVSSTYRLVA